MDAPFSRDDMKKDLPIFKEIRENANSGIYRFRTKQQIDSIFQWAFHQVDQSNTYLDFYNILVKLEDFEGSCHNGTWVAGPISESMKQESKGYFPYPLIRIEGKLLMNAINKEIPLEAEILSINNEKVEVIFQNLFKYYTTDGNIIDAKYTKRNFRENKSAWISFRKLPNLKYIDTKVPRFLRPLGAWLLYNRTLRKEFSINRNGRYY